MRYRDFVSASPRWRWLNRLFSAVPCLLLCCWLGCSGEYEKRLSERRDVPRRRQAGGRGQSGPGQRRAGRQSGRRGQSGAGRQAGGRHGVWGRQPTRRLVESSFGHQTARCFMYRRMLGFVCLVGALSCLGCDKDPLAVAETAGDSGGDAPTGGLDEMSQPVKTPAPAALLRRRPLRPRRRRLPPARELVTNGIYSVFRVPLLGTSSAGARVRSMTLLVPSSGTRWKEMRANQGRQADGTE